MIVHLGRRSYQRCNHGCIQPRLRSSCHNRRVSSGKWVLLAYRLPREPSTPRITVWRALKRLGAAQLVDGLVALPADSRTREQLEWLAETVIEAGGEATIWLGQAGSVAQERAITERMRAVVAAEYRKITQDASAARSRSAGARKRTLGRLRRELRRVRARDYFRAPEQVDATATVEALARDVEEAAA